MGRVDSVPRSCAPVHARVADDESWVIRVVVCAPRKRTTCLGGRAGARSRSGFVDCRRRLCRRPGPRTESDATRGLASVVGGTHRPRSRPRHGREHDPQHPSARADAPSGGPHTLAVRKRRDRRHPRERTARSHEPAFSSIECKKGFSVQHGIGRTDFTCMIFLDSFRL